jgi:hypothetical protein
LTSKRVIEMKNSSTRFPVFRFLILTAAVIMVSAVSVPADESVKEVKALETATDSAVTAVADTSAMTLEGGSDGTLFESLRVEGEDRVRVRFERPPLSLSLDSGSAPGLEWKSVQDVLARIGVDMINPFLARSAGERRAYFTRPWLDGFSTDGVARFQPALDGVDKWRLLVADSKGDTVASFSGKGKPPKEIIWDGRSLGGSHVAPGLVYSYVLEAYDRAGNKRNFVGEGFELSSYRVDADDGHAMMFSGSELSQTTSSYGEAAPTPEILLEIASWVNQEEDLGSQVLVEATFLADRVKAQLTPLLLGDPLRIRTVTVVEPDAAARGSIAVVVSR